MVNSHGLNLLQAIQNESRSVKKSLKDVVAENEFEKKLLAEVIPLGDIGGGRFGGLSSGYSVSGGLYCVDLSEVELIGEYTPDLTALLAADIIISTPENWDGISRNWHTRGYVGVMILDEIHLLGADRGPILEVIVSRMRFISSQTERSVRFVGLSIALANAHDLADWLGFEENGLFNFKPSVRPVPLEVHIQVTYSPKYYVYFLLKYLQYTDSFFNP
ncbi:activating signal cointegrator 1 complex subunit 3 [Striga asiatica]|uniref:Activating signal cointegrator 1 complex subunit 3 n=1 Tax=Striga asiatica TaxID=4170 RepID=A0A5A7RFG0_STRAF|nr:activating signal cointegrator 1 complex subunit 3 [Striga asiatica]